MAGSIAGLELRQFRGLKFSEKKGIDDLGLNSYLEAHENQ
jgi:hypothetical protein